MRQYVLEASMYFRSRILTLYFADLVASTLSLLLSELPDPHQELFIQALITEFALFPKLPIELRNTIWRATFPIGRRISLQGLIDLGPGPYISTPIASRVNKESRAEFLTKYGMLMHVYSRNTLKGRKWTFKLVFFHPDMDIVTMTLHLMLSEWLSPEKFPVFVQKWFISGYSAVKVLEMRPAAWDDSFINIIYSLNGNYLKFFRGLEKFRMVRGPVRLNGASHWDLQGENQKKCFEFFEKYFNHWKGYYTHENTEGLVGPKITVYDDYPEDQEPPVALFEGAEEESQDIGAEEMSADGEENGD